MKVPLKETKLIVSKFVLVLDDEVNLSYIKIRAGFSLLSVEFEATTIRGVRLDLF